MKEYFNKDNYHYIKLICAYTITLDIVYSYWCYKSDLPWWAVLLVAVGFVLVGGIVLLLYIKNVKKQYEKLNQDTKTNESENESENKNDISVN